MTPILTPGLTAVLLRTQSDERLVLLAARGHERAFAAIVDRYRPQLTRMLRRLFPTAPIDDVVQLTFLSAWRAIERGAEIRDLSPWLHRIARNAALAEIKRPGGDHAELYDDMRLSDGPELIIERREDVRRALEVIADLPPRQRAALIAVAVEGRPSQDTAAELGISDTAARKLVSRARATLRAAATAITPPPLLTWLLQAGHASAAGEGLAGAALSAGGAVTLVKVGAAVTAVGIAASAPVAIHARAHATLAPPAAIAAHSASAAPTTTSHAASAAARRASRAAADNGGALIVTRSGHGDARVIGMSRAAAGAQSVPASTTPTTTSAATAPATATLPTAAGNATAKTANATAARPLWPWRKRPTRPRPHRPWHPPATTTAPTYTRPTYTRPTYTQAPSTTTTTTQTATTATTATTTTTTEPATTTTTPTPVTETTPTTTAPTTTTP